MVLTRRIIDHLRWRKMVTYSIIASRYLDRVNRTTARSVVDPSSSVDVSLTTYGPRTQQVYLAIESIARGTVRPARLVLWLDEQALVDDPPVELKRLVDRGLTLRVANPHHGPHKKYFPYTQEFSNDRRALVTADDDTIYPRSWLAQLVKGYHAQPDAVNCYRAHRVAYRGTGYAPYAVWPQCIGHKTSAENFATGSSGIIYGPEMVEVLRRLGDRFLDVCPRADDVWLYFAVTSSGWGVRQIADRPRLFPILPGTDDTGLAFENTVLKGNDAQIAATAALFANMRRDPQLP